MRDVPIIPMGEEPGSAQAAGDPRPRPWQTAGRLSSTGVGLAGRASGWLDAAEHFLAGAGFDRAPWLAVVFAGGIITWFAASTPWQWLAAMAGGVGAALAARVAWPPDSAADERRANLRLAVIACGLLFALGVGTVWARSAIVGAEPIARPMVALI